MKSTSGGFVIGGLLMAGVAGSAGAQDANYWTIQYGPVAELLGGQVVGSTRDLSATYYNPGGLALGKEKAFLLSVQTVLLQGVTVNTPAPLQPASSWTLGIAPTLIAGTFPKDWFGEDTRLAWSYLTRQQLNVVLDTSAAGNLSGSGARYGAESRLDQSMTEGWGGLTLCHRLSDSWGLGITAYGVYRGQQTRREENAQSSGSGGVTALSVDNLSYYHWRTLAKVGVAWDASDTLKLGLAVTTPSVGLFGGAKTAFTTSVSGVDGSGKPINSLANGVDDNAQAQYRSSTAIAGGASWRRGATTLHVSGEWFAPVASYAVITSDVGGKAPVQVLQELKGVFNVGAAFEHQFPNGSAAYGAVGTDASAAVGAPGTGINTSNWNLLHLTGGTSFRVIGSRLTLGASYAFGSSTRTLGFEGLPPEVPVLGARPGAGVHYTRLTFVLGFVFGGS